MQRTQRAGDRAKRAPGVGSAPGHEGEHTEPSRFRGEFGLTPKVAGRVMRFEVANHLLRAPGRPGLAEELPAVQDNADAEVHPGRHD